MTPVTTTTTSAITTVVFGRAHGSPRAYAAGRTYGLPRQRRSYGLSRSYHSLSRPYASPRASRAGASESGS